MLAVFARVTPCGRRTASACTALTPRIPPAPSLCVLVGRETPLLPAPLRRGAHVVHMSGSRIARAVGDTVPPTVSAGLPASAGAPGTAGTVDAPAVRPGGTTLGRGESDESAGSEAARGPRPPFIAALISGAVP